MIRWCSYCQALLGEVEPYAQYEVSHGICERCEARLEADEPLLAEYDAAIRLYRELFAAAHAGDQRTCVSLAARARELGFDATALAVGLIQPALVEIGRKWEEGSVTVADEHRFTAWCEAMLAMIDRPMPPEGPLELLIVNAPGNRHQLGARIAELALLGAGIRARAIAPGRPIPELLALVAAHRPAWVGLSCALPYQLPQACEAATQLSAAGHAGRVILSGGALRCSSGARPEIDAHVCVTIEQARDLIMGDRERAQR
jgi:methanogenic corrinoid protein MtbC1